MNPCLTYSEQANFGWQEEENLRGAQQQRIEDKQDKQRDDGRSSRAM
jgi:hypothetical protein